MSHDIIVLATILLGAIAASMFGRIFGKVIDDLGSEGNRASDWLFRYCATFALALIALWIGGHYFGLVGGVLVAFTWVYPGYWLVGELVGSTERYERESSAKSRSRSSSISNDLSKGFVSFGSFIVALIWIVVALAKFGPVSGVVVAIVGTVLAPVLAVGGFLLIYITVCGILGGVIPQLFQLLGRALDRQGERISSLLRKRRAE